MFDPFNDFQTAGYLRNSEAQKDPKKVRRAEFVAFQYRLEQALDQLKRRRGTTCAVRRRLGDRLATAQDFT